MIPKIIHYCWFGGNDLPKEYRGYIESWKRYCPDYKIIEWNEQTFDINSNEYVKQAYNMKKWAFVTDYVRLYALCKYGGIYLDTDVEILKSIDVFLNDKGFSGFENKIAVPTGIMGAEANHPFIEDLLLEYDNRKFVDENGKMDLTTNVTKITECALKYGLVINDSKQVVCEFTFYPTEYFCPKSSRTLEIDITDNTYTIHHFAGSWNNSSIAIAKKVIKRILPKCILNLVIKKIDVKHEYN